MIKVKVKTVGAFKKRRGNSEDELVFPEPIRVGDVLKTMAEREIFDFSESSMASGRGSVLQNTLVLVNGVEIGNLDGLKTNVGDGDSMVLISVSHGG